MLLVKNKKAHFNSEILATYVAGVMLKGYEVKAIREHNVNFEGSYVKFENNELVISNLNIGHYSKQSQKQSSSPFPRMIKLLLTQREISAIRRELSEKGKSAILLAFILKNNLIKLEFGIARGKKKHEKLQALKEKQIEMDLRRMQKWESYL